MVSGKEFLVIGVGLPRTGTLSTKLALETILPGKCYHMTETFSSNDHSDFWIRMCNNTINDEEIREFFLSRGYIVCVDAPATFFYRRLMKVFPNAKFLLNTRDPSGWVISMKATLCKVHRFMSMVITLRKWLGPFGKLVLSKTTFMSALFKPGIGMVEMIWSCDNDTGENFFNKWNDSIIEEIPQDKLLVFDVKQGWEPLCELLEVPIPTTEFPRVNDKKEFAEKLQKLKEPMVKGVTMLFSLAVAAISVEIYYKFYS